MQHAHKIRIDGYNNLSKVFYSGYLTYLRRGVYQFIFYPAKERPAFRHVASPHRYAGRERSTGKGDDDTDEESLLAPKASVIKPLFGGRVGCDFYTAFRQARFGLPTSQNSDFL